MPGDVSAREVVSERVPHDGCNGRLGRHIDNDRAVHAPGADQRRIEPGSVIRRSDHHKLPTSPRSRPGIAAGPSRVAPNSRGRGRPSVFPRRDGIKLVEDKEARRGLLREVEILLHTLKDDVEVRVFVLGAPPRVTGIMTWIGGFTVLPVLSGVPSCSPGRSGQRPPAGPVLRRDPVPPGNIPHQVDECAPQPPPHPGHECYPAVPDASPAASPGRSAPPTAARGPG